MIVSPVQNYSLMEFSSSDCPYENIIDSIKVNWLAKMKKMQDLLLSAIEETTSLVESAYSVQHVYCAFVYLCTSMQSQLPFMF